MAALMVLGLSLFDIAVHPTRSNGFPLSIVGAVIAVGVLALVGRWLSSKPKRGTNEKR